MLTVGEQPGRRRGIELRVDVAAGRVGRVDETDHGDLERCRFALATTFVFDPTVRPADSAADVFNTISPAFSGPRPPGRIQRLVRVEGLRGRDVGATDARGVTGLDGLAAGVGDRDQAVVVDDELVDAELRALIPKTDDRAWHSR